MNVTIRFAAVRLAAARLAAARLAAALALVCLALPQSAQSAQSAPGIDEEMAYQCLAVRTLETGAGDLDQSVRDKSTEFAMAWSRYISAKFGIFDDFGAELERVMQEVLNALISVNKAGPAAMEALEKKFQICDNIEKSDPIFKDL